MTDQIRISDSGELEIQPLTWDGEPMFSAATVQEGLFAAEAFEQMPGQLAMTETLYCELCNLPIEPSEPAHRDPADEIAHADCARDWFRRNYGAESLS